MRLTTLRRSLAVIAILTAVFMSATSAQAGDCWKVKDNDDRYYCESIYEGKDNCWRIQVPDRKHMCESLKGKQNCWRIKNEDYKNMCKAQTGQ